MKKSEIILLKKIISNIVLDSEFAYDELFKKFTQDIGMPLISVPLKQNSYSYRSRNNINNENFLNFSDLTYPLQKYVSRYSRANKPGQQIFYSSDNIDTNITELMPYWSKDLEIGDKFSITVGKWIFKKEINVAIIPDFSNERMMEFLNKLPSLKDGTPEWEYWEFINTFFRVQGFYQPNIYKFTSAFCNALIKNSQIFGASIDGIMYTSVKDPSGWNLAISPKFVDENMELSKVFKLFLSKTGIVNGKPLYNNFQTPDPILPKMLDFDLKKIIW